MVRVEMRNIESSNIRLTFGENPSTRTWQISKKVIKNITVEPVIFFYAIGFGITTVITASLYFDKICKVNFITFLFFYLLNKR